MTGEDHSSRRGGLLPTPSLPSFAGSAGASRCWSGLTVYGRSPPPTRWCAPSAKIAFKQSSMKLFQAPTSGQCSGRSHDNKATT